MLFWCHLVFCGLYFRVTQSDNTVFLLQDNNWRAKESLADRSFHLCYYCFLGNYYLS